MVAVLLNGGFLQSHSDSSFHEVLYKASSLFAIVKDPGAIYGPPFYLCKGPGD